MSVAHRHGGRDGSRTAGQGALITADRHPEAASQGTNRVPERYTLSLLF